MFGDGDFEGVDYSLVAQGSGNLLRITPIEKRWGPEYLRLGLALSSTLSQGASYSLRAAWHRTWINHWGGQLLAVGELGNTNGVSGEWLQPIGVTSPWFVDASLGYRRQRLDLFAGDDRIAEYVIERSSIRFDTGLNVGTLGQLRLGWHATRWQPQLSTGLPVFGAERARHHGLVAQLELDRMNRRFFPTDGLSLIHISEPTRPY